MSATLIARSSALQRILEEGYALRVHDGPSGAYLVVEDVPYVNLKRQVRRGTLVSPLEMGGDGGAAAPVSNHQMWFVGEHPCHANGSNLIEIQHGSAEEDYGNGLVVNHSFSAKIPGGKNYDDYYHKITQYVAIISSPAEYLRPGISARGCHPYVPGQNVSVFKYPDTATSRAGIGVASSRIASQKIGVIGLGGTGSYVLDFVAKTHVSEIHLFDNDCFKTHNAYRSPGAPAADELTEPPKVAYYAAHYSRMREGILPHAYHVTRENIGEFSGFDFVFVCIDKPEARKPIMEGLIALKVPFIDVGMDVRLSQDGRLTGQCRTTLATPERHGHLSKFVSFESGAENDIYAAHIQVAELNALNAVNAILMWKKLFGFYVDDLAECNSVYTIACHMLTKDKS